MRDGLKAKYSTLRNISHVLSSHEMHVENGAIKVEILDRINADKELQTTAALPSDQSIDIEKIFDGVEDKPCKKVVLYGKPGVGKSTLCQLLSVKWQEDKLWEERFDNVVWISLKELDDDKEEINVFSYIASTVIKHCLLEANLDRYSIEELSSYISDPKNRSRMLFILDGYDEVAERMSVNIRQMLSFLIEDPNCWLLLTSRPITIELKGRRPAFDRVLENVGFTKEGVKQYIESYHEADASGLMQLFHTKKAVSDIAHVPLLLELVCNMYIENPEAAHTFSLSEMYSQLSKLMFAYYNKRQQTKLTAGQEEILVSLLEDIAIRAMADKTSHIHPNLIMHLIKPYQKEWDGASLYRVLLDLGLIKAVRKTQSDLCNPVYFIHHTLQEYFAASKLAKGFVSCDGSKELKDAERFLQQHRYTEYYREVWIHVVNIIYLECKEEGNYMMLARFWDYFENGSKDILGMTHEQLKASLLGSLSISGDAPKALQIIRNKLIDNNALIQIMLETIKQDEDFIEVIRSIDGLVELQDASHQVEKAISTACKKSSYDVVRIFAEEALLRLGVDVNTADLQIMKVIDGITDPERFIEKKDLDQYRIKSYAREEYAIRALARCKTPIAGAVEKLKNIYKTLANYTEDLNDHFAQNFGEFKEVSHILKLTIMETVVALTQGKDLDLVMECYSYLKHDNAKVQSFACEAFGRLSTHKLIYQTLDDAYSDVLQHQRIEIDHIFILLAEHKLYTIEHKRSTVNRGLWGYAVMPGVALSLLGGSILSLPTILLGSWLGTVVLASPILKRIPTEVQGLALLFSAIPSISLMEHIKESKYIENTTESIYNNIHSYIGSWYAQQEAHEILDEILHKNPRDLLQQVAAFVESDGQKVASWVTQGALDLPLAIELFSYYCSATRYNPGIWLAPMHNIMFVCKNPKALLLLVNNYIEYQGRPITHNGNQTQHVLKALKQGFINGKMPTTLLDHYISGRRMFVSTEEERIAIARRYKSARKLALTDLHKAAAAGNLGEVKRLVEEGEIDINDFNNDNWETPLILAIRGRHWDIVHYLVEQGADVNFGFATELAAFEGANYGLIEFMFAHIAKVDDKLLRTALMRAVEDYKLQNNPQAGDAVIKRLITALAGSTITMIKYSEEADRYRMMASNASMMRRETGWKIEVKGTDEKRVLGFKLRMYMGLYIQLSVDTRAQLFNTDKFANRSIEEDLERLYTEVRARIYHI